MSLYVMTPPEWWLAISHRTTSAFLPGTRKSIAWPEACFEGVLVPCDDSAGTAGRDDFYVAEVVADPAKQVAGGRRQTRRGGTGGAAGMSVAGPGMT